ncbi:meprin A subunit beta-like [Paramacrobiotus metropolitanus]|uniref:meprin A subunit beta-like n=1 Tax=Paramacrobiotus metropolitanus TaxID=2943436 RepID=UPI002445AF7F|nr:meprin A subunit beta-like [Paramacrobiotus metropolitanus]
MRGFYLQKSDTMFLRPMRRVVLLLLVAILGRADGAPASLDLGAIKKSAGTLSTLPPWQDILWPPATSEDVETDAEANRLAVPSALIGRMPRYDYNYWNHSGNCVPYEMHSAFDPEMRQQIEIALTAIEQATHGCIGFKQREHQEEYITFIRSRAALCTAELGRTPSKPTKVILGKGCMGNGTVMHEVIHALGFYHEHSRPDRNFYVDVFLHNAQKGTDERNFDILQDMPVFNLPYDYESIMHYAPTDFAFNAQQRVIVPKIHAPLNIGHRQQLSMLDVLRLKIAYGCLDENLAPVSKKLSNPCSTESSREDEQPELMASTVRSALAYLSNKEQVDPTRDSNRDFRNQRMEVVASESLSWFSNKPMTKDQCAAQFTHKCWPMQQDVATCARFWGLELNCDSSLTLAEMQHIIGVLSKPPIRPVRVQLYDGPLITSKNFASLQKRVVQFTLKICVNGRTSGKLTELSFTELREFRLHSCYDLEIKHADFKQSGNLQIIIFEESTILSIERLTFTDLLHLRILSLEFGPLKLLNSDDRFRTHVESLHCHCRFSWFRRWLKVDNKLLWKTEPGAIYKLKKAFRNTGFTKRDLYFPVDCNKHIPLNASLVNFDESEYSLHDTYCRDN